MYWKDTGRVHVGGKNTVGVGMSNRKPDNAPIYMKERTINFVNFDNHSDLLFALLHC